MKPKLKILVAEDDKVCSCCNGVIPKGHKYWENHYGVAEHTNCEMYTIKDNRRKPRYDAAV